MAWLNFLFIDPAFSKVYHKLSIIVTTSVIIIILPMFYYWHVESNKLDLDLFVWYNWQLIIIMLLQYKMTNVINHSDQRNIHSIYPLQKTIYM